MLSGCPPLRKRNACDRGRDPNWFASTPSPSAARGSLDRSIPDRCPAARHRGRIAGVQPDMTDSIDREALLAAGLDPDDPEEWVTQRRVSDFLRCYSLWLENWSR